MIHKINLKPQTGMLLYAACGTKAEILQVVDDIVRGVVLIKGSWKPFEWDINGKCSDKHLNLNFEVIINVDWDKIIEDKIIIQIFGKTSKPEDLTFVRTSPFVPNGHTILTTLNKPK